MTDLKVGQELTYEQVIGLPDGAVFTVLFAHGGSEPDKHTECNIVRVGNQFVYTETLEVTSVGSQEHWLGHRTYIPDSGWNSARLVSLPETAQEQLSEKVGELPQPESTEIAKRAALTLIKTLRDDVDRATGSATDSGVYVSCTAYIEAYDYARSIGAIDAD